MTDSLTNVRKEAKNYKFELDRLANELDYVRNEKKDLDKNLSEKLAKINELKTNLKLDKESIEALENKLTNMTNSLEKKENKINKLTIDNQKLSEQIQQLINERQDIEAYEDLKNENIKLKKLNDDQFEQIDYLNKELTDVFNQYNYLSQQREQHDNFLYDNYGEPFLSVELDESSVKANDSFVKKKIRHSQSTIENLAISSRKLMNSNISLEKDVENLKKKYLDLQEKQHK